jgi:predicted nucleic acid-binding protein
VRSVYIETTVVSYYVAHPSRDVTVAARQQTTRELWPKLTAHFDVFISMLVREEAGKGDQQQAALRLRSIAGFATLEADEAALTLAAKIIDDLGIPKDPEDALHVAIAAVNGIDALVTWNFAHLNNPFTRTKVRQIVEDAGYGCPEICSPDELLESTP